MNRTVLQIPMSPTLRQRAEREALYQGFSSIQEAVRIFLSKLANKKIGITFGEESVKLSPRAIKRYNKILHDIESGKEKLYKAKSVEDLMRQLNS